MSFSGFNSESSDSFGSDWGGSLVPSPGGNPLVGMLRNLLPAAMVGVGGAVVNAVTTPFQQRRQQQKREDFEQIMLVAKYKADGSLQTRQFGHDLEVQGNQHRHDLTMLGNQFGHDLTMQGNQFAHDRAMFQQNATLQVGLQENQFAHDRAMFQENKALQLGLQYLEHGQQNALQQRQFAHDGAMFQQQRELQLGLHYLSTQAAKEAAIEQYKLAQDSHEYKMARQLFPNLSLKGMGDKCTEAIDYGRATPLYVIPSSFKIADYYGLELFGDVPDWPQKFTKFLDQLNNQRLQLLRQFLGAYGAGDGQRSALLLWGVWSDHCADEAAHLNLHALGRGVVPMVASEVKVSGDQLVVLLSYVGIQESFCQQLLALPFGELLRGLAINEALRWEEKRQQLLAKQTRSEAEINARGGINEQNRQLWLEEQEDLAADRHLSSEDYPYQRGHLGGQAGTLIAVCELVGQLLAVDLHYLASAMDVQRGTLLTPALPRLLPQLFQTLIASGLTAILRQLVSTIVQAYVQALQKLQLQALIPDLVLEIAQELAGIENNELTSLLTEFSLKTLAGLRNLGVEVSLEGVRPLEAAIFKEDRDLVHRINGCLVALNHSERIEIDRAYFDRGVACLQRGDFAQAVQELSTKLELNATVEAYWQRARAYFGLQDWDNALVDLNQVAVLQHRLAEVFELRGDILRQQGEIQLAITAYNQAQEKGSPTAQRKREDLQRWWQDHERQKRANQHYEAGVAHWQACEFEAALAELGQAERYGHAQAGETLAKVKADQERRKALIYKLPDGGGDLEFVWVPSGELIMVDGGHRVQVPEFRIGQFPVTQRQYQAVMQNNHSCCFDDDDLTSKEKKKGLTHLDRPVESVTWHQAVEFCQKLTEILKIEGYEVRLPSETMWEWAARDAENSSLTFAGSNDLNQVGWYDDNAGNKTHPVGQKKANKLGIHDMSGNVWEWCWDNWSSSSNVLPQDGKPLLKGGNNTYRAVRGGSWDNNADYCRSGHRDHDLPGNSNNNQGLRVVLLPVSFLA